jgi:hypothetical protein
VANDKGRLKMIMGFLGACIINDFEKII